jgi:hypothetical protein
MLRRIYNIYSMYRLLDSPQGIDFSGKDVHIVRWAALQRAALELITWVKS